MPTCAWIAAGDTRRSVNRRTEPLRAAAKAQTDASDAPPPALVVLPSHRGSIPILRAVTLGLKPLSVQRFFLLALVVLLLDQGTKLAVLSRLGDGTMQVIVPRFLQLLYRTNTGAAFSILQAHPLPLKIFSTFVVIVLAGWSTRLRGRDQKLRLPLGLILGGATANLTDRYFRGHVIDFIDAHWDDVYHFPTFNVADSSICIGVGLLMLMILTGGADPDEAGAQGESHD